MKTNSFKTIYLVASRELHKIVRDKNIWLVCLVAPLLYPLLYGFVYYNKIETKLPIAVIDNDDSYLSRQLLQTLDANQNIKIVHDYFTRESKNQAFLKGEIQGIVEIPDDFAKSIKQGKQTSVTLTISTGRLLVFSDIAIPVSQNVSSFGGTITASVLQSKNVPVMQDNDLAQPIKVQFVNLFNPFLTYGDLILPGLFIIIFSQLILISSATATSKEWYGNNRSELYSITKNPLLILAGKLFNYLVLFSFSWVLTRYIIIPIFDIPFIGKDTDFLIIILLGIISSASLGLFVGSFFKYKILVFAVLGFTSYPFFLITGYAWPQLQLPLYMKIISYIIPLTPLMQATTSITQLGNSLGYVSLPIIILITQILVFSILIMFRIKYLQRAGIES